MASSRQVPRSSPRLDINSISPITPEVMSRQATINVGTIGHVAHGKSTVVKALTGVKTQKHQREAVLNITIHIGYANAKVFQCPKCPRPACYHSFASAQPEDTPCPTCSEPMKLMRHFSFVDCPGHDVLMATMLNGAAIMDAALLLIAANEAFPQSQTLEHLAAVEMMGVQHVMVLQNKIDLVTALEATAQAEKIRRYLAANTAYGAAPIIPTFANAGMNMDYVLEYLCHIPLAPSVFAKSAGVALPPVSVPSSSLSPSPSRGHRARASTHDGRRVTDGGGGAAAAEAPSPSSPSSVEGQIPTAAPTSATSATLKAPCSEDSAVPTGSSPVATHGATMAATLSVLRSFDVSLPGEMDGLCGGVVGGTLNAGVLCVGDVIEILPGLLCLDPQRPRANAPAAPLPGSREAVAAAEGALSRHNVLGGRVLSYLSSPPPGALYSVPLRATVLSLRAEQNRLPFAVPGGLIAVGTSLDPCLTRQNKLRGHVLRVVQSRQSSYFLIDRPLASPVQRTAGPVDDAGLHVFIEIDIQFFLLKELLGVRSGGRRADGGERRAHHREHVSRSLVRIPPLHTHESVILSVGTLSSAATVTRTARSAGRAVCRLENPMCGRVGDRLVLARYVEGKVRVIGWGTIKRGIPLDVLHHQDTSSPTTV